MNILHFLSDLFYDVVSCFAAMEVWTGCLLAGFIKPSADRYICRSGVTEPAAIEAQGSKMAQNCLMLPAIVQDSASDVEESSSPRVSAGVSHR